VGGARVASGAISVGTLVAFLLYIYYLIPPVQAVAGAYSQYQYGAAAIRRIQEAERLPIEPADMGPPPGPRNRSPRAVGVTFDVVSFRYAADLPLVLDEISFQVPPLGMTAIVGPSGAGKTTTFSLIERFYDPERGPSRRRRAGCPGLATGRAPRGDRIRRAGRTDPVRDAAGEPALRRAGRHRRRAR
jgi:ATP-binding cassette subfamily C protein